MAEQPSPRVLVDREACVGHGRCYDLAPDIFEPDEDGYSTVVGEPAGPATLKDLDRARRNCPERAILVLTETSGSASERKEG